MSMKCATCPKMGESCVGPKFYRMMPEDISLWCRLRKKYLGLTNAKIAELSGMAPGTVDGILAGSHSDFRVGTIQPILKVLVGNEWEGDACQEMTNAEEVEYKERIKKLETEIEWRDDKLKYLANEIDLLRKHNEEATRQITEATERHKISQDFLRSRLKLMDRVVKVLAVLLGLAWIVMIGALIIDKTDPTKGFFWLTDVSWLNFGNLFKMNG